MRHSGGAGRPLHRNLGEHAAGDIHPHVHTQIVQDAVGVADGAVQFGLPIMRLDLRGQRVPGQTHAVRDEFAGDGHPIDIWARGEMRAESTGGTIDLAQVFLCPDFIQLAVQTIHIDGEFLAQRGRCGGLAVGQGQHGLVAVLVGLVGQMVDDGLCRGQPYVLYAVLHATRDGQVVDVLGCASEMHEGFQTCQLGVVPQHIGGFLQLGVDVIFHSLHIVVGLGLIRGVLGDAFGAEILRDGTQERLFLIGERLDAGDDGLVAVAIEAIGEQDHPFDLDAHAFAVQCGLAHVFDKGSGLPVIAAIKRGQCDCGGDISKLHRV